MGETMTALRQVKGLVEEVEELSAKQKAKNPKATSARVPKSRWRKLALGETVVLLMVLGVAGFTANRLAARTVEVAELEAKLEYVFVEPILQRILLSNPKNEQLQEHKDYLRKVIRLAIHVAYFEEPKVPIEVLLGVLKIESRFNPAALNKLSGATGIGQVMPAFHAVRLSEKGILRDHWLELNDPEVGVKAAAEILRKYLKQTGNLDAALKKYGGYGNRPSGDREAAQYVSAAKSL